MGSTTSGNRIGFATLVPRPVFTGSFLINPGTIPTRFYPGHTIFFAATSKYISYFLLRKNNTKIANPAPGCPGRYRVMDTE